MVPAASFDVHGIVRPAMHIHDLNEYALNEVFDRLSLAERLKCELVCRCWRQVLRNRTQRAIKLCFEAKPKTTKPICSTRSHRASANDVLFFQEEESPASNRNSNWHSNRNSNWNSTANGPTPSIENENVVRIASLTIHNQQNGEEKFGRLFAKFGQTTAVHLQSKDIKLLRKTGVFAGLSKHAARLEHLEIELFEGPFTRNDLLLLFRNWTKSLKHLLITFHFDKGKYLNRWVNELYFPGDSPNPLLVLNSGFRTDARS